MTQRSPHPPRGTAMPVTPISPGDLAVIAEMIRGYLVFVRLRFRASSQREAYVQYVEQLRKRLATRYQDNTPIPLTVADIETIEAAMCTFETFMSLMAPATKERDASIQTSVRLRQRIAAMRAPSGVPVRRPLN